MALTLHYASGSPYAWRVWLALEHKGIPYELKLLSFDKGDLATSAFRALNPRGRVPALEDDGFALYELATAVLFTKPEERSPERIARACEDIRRELALWDTALTGDWLAGPLSAVDFTLYPELALVLRMASRNPGLIAGDLMGDKVAAWAGRMEALPIVQKTWPPHWK